MRTQERTTQPQLASKECCLLATRAKHGSTSSLHQKTVLSGQEFASNCEYHCSKAEGALLCETAELRSTSKVKASTSEATPPVQSAASQIVDKALKFITAERAAVITDHPAQYSNSFKIGSASILDKVWINCFV